MPLLVNSAAIGPSKASAVRTGYLDPFAYHLNASLGFVEDDVFPEKFIGGGVRGAEVHGEVCALGGSDVDNSVPGKGGWPVEAVVFDAVCDLRSEEADEWCSPDITDDFFDGDGALGFAVVAYAADLYLAGGGAAEVLAHLVFRVIEGDLSIEEIEGAVIEIEGAGGVFYGDAAEGHVLEPALSGVFSRGFLVEVEGAVQGDFDRWALIFREVSDDLLEGLAFEEGLVVFCGDGGDE